MNMNAPRLLTEAETARYLGISRATLERWRAQGHSGAKATAPVPRFIKLGSRAVRYDRADLDEFIATQRRLSTSETSPEPNRSAS